MAARGPEQPGFFQGLVEGIHEGVLLLDPDGTILWASPSACRLLERDLAELVGRPTTDFEPEMDALLSRARRAEREGQAPDERAPWQRVLRTVLLPDGRESILDCTLSDLCADERVGAHIVLLREATETHHTWETERRLRALLENSQDALVVYDRDLNLVYANPNVGDLLDDLDGTLVDHMRRFVDPPQVRGALRVFDAVVATPGRQAERLLRLTRTDGVAHWVQVRMVNLLDDPAVAGLVVNGRDVTAQVELEQTLRDAATKDPLTGLPNRAALGDLLAAELTELPEGEQLVVLFLDLDRFKVVNDSFGHVVGDRVLAELGGRLKEVIGERGTVGRFGGDEYVVVAAVEGEGDAVELAGVLSAAASQPFQVESPQHERAEVFLSGSVGIALSSHSRDPATLLHHADAAMYRAKERGRGTWELYDDRMRSAALSRLTLEADLARALDDRGFEVWYQPIVDVDTRRPVAMEALARWRSRSGGVISPAEFIPVAEETGGIHRLGAWALATACSQVRRWTDEGIDLPVSVNLSPRQIGRVELATDIRDLLEATDLPPERLTLEITESLLMDDLEGAVKALRALKDIGVRLALDDFGTGYSSLTYLRVVPVDVVKIDQSFVTGVVDSPDDRAIVGAVVSMCRALGKRVVAEGVETEAQLQALGDLGADLAQGYLFAQPLPAAELPGWFERYRAAGNRNR